MWAAANNRRLRVGQGEGYHVKPVGVLVSVMLGEESSYELLLIWMGRVKRGGLQGRRGDTQDCKAKESRRRLYEVADSFTWSKQRGIGEDGRICNVPVSRTLVPIAMGPTTHISMSPLALY